MSTSGLICSKASTSNLSVSTSGSISSTHLSAEPLSDSDFSLTSLMVDSLISLTFSVSCNIDNSEMALLASN